MYIDIQIKHATVFSLHRLSEAQLACVYRALKNYTPTTNEPRADVVNVLEMQKEIELTANKFNQSQILL